MLVKPVSRWYQTNAAAKRCFSSAYLQEKFSLEGFSAVVTGGGTGIGAAIAMGLSRAGASVVLTGRRVEPLEETVQNILSQLKKDEPEGDLKRRIAAVPCDITDFSTLPSLMESAFNHTKIKPTILINNAGINVRQNVESLTEDHWEMSTKLMLTAPFMLARAMAPNMKERKHGRIISIASLQSFQAFPDSIPYAAAKSGLLGLTRALSEAYSPHYGYNNVTVNAVAPGYVKTSLTASVFADEERSRRLADATLLGRNSVPEDLAGPVTFLASEAAAYITGQTIPVDGGFTALGMR